MPPFVVSDYIDVQERISRFWQEYPDGAIRTELASGPLDFTVCRYRAEVYKQATNEHPDATGYAFEHAVTEGRGPNTTSHEENCETSAIGRALANMGYARSRKDRPSKQEMEKVNRGMPVQTPDLDKPNHPLSDADFKSFVEKCGTNPNNWKEAMDLAAADQTRWDLIEKLAPSEAWRNRFAELRPKQGTVA